MIWSRFHAGAFAASAALFAFAGCSFTLKHADAVQGTAVQQKIDESIAPLIKSYYPKLRIEPSQCEPIIVMSQSTMGTCTLPVNGAPLAIRVAGSGPPDMFKVDFGGSFFFDMPTVENIIERSLAHDYKVPVKGAAHCGVPRERLLLPGTYVTCSVDGTSLVHVVRLKISQNGQIFLFHVPGLKVAEILPSALLTAHKQGRAVVISGASVAAHIQRLVADGPAAVDHRAIVTCPHKMDLTGTKHGVCAAAIPGLRTPQRLGFWIDPVAGFYLRPIDAVIDRAKVQKMAQDDLNLRLTDNGNSADAVVICGQGLVVIEPPGTFDCKAVAAGKRYRLVVVVQDWKGTVAWHGVPLH